MNGYSIYLSPTVPVWTPHSEQDLVDGIQDGLLQESHFLEAKREIPTRGKANDELAKDLAQFAVDGGILIVGVGESEDGQMTKHPVHITQLPERIEQVARALIEPPLEVAFTTIEASANDGTGYLVVHVPPSPHAPHMVRGRYYGRGEKTKRVLTDAEILRLHQQRILRKQSSADALQRMIDSDPLPDGDTAHFFFVAVPSSANPQMASTLLDGDGWRERFNAVTTAGNTVPGINCEPSLSLGRAGVPADTGDGRSLHTGELLPGRVINPDIRSPEYLIEVQIAESGELRCFTGQVSQLRSDGFGRDPEQVLFDIVPLQLTRQLLQATAEEARQIGYLGSWELGVAITGLAGMKIVSRQQVFPSRDPDRFDTQHNTYLETCSVTLTELSSQPGSVTRRLLQRFLRGCGRSGAHDATFLSDPA